ncbi:MAG: HIT domain-containing protein [Anaerolineales bacterium]|nr:HIT domain-containing protein [Anaerolineales bacterium]
MKYIWSPWRMDYIKDPHKNDACVFCQVLEEPESVETLVVFRGKQAYLILNRFPYTSGHLMVVPYEHHSELEDLDEETRAEIMEMASRATQVLKEIYRPEGFNVGINIGEAAGAGITEHIHLHIVPRWQGDTNFMSTLGQTRVLPESLEDTYQQVKKIWTSFKR